MKESMRILKQQLENGESKASGLHCIQRGQLELWIANGIGFFNGYNSPSLQIPFWDRMALWKAYEKGRDKQLIEALNKSNDTQYH